jgi:hypothetical protein
MKLDRLCYVLEVLELHIMKFLDYYIKKEYFFYQHNDEH